MKTKPIKAILIKDITYKNEGMEYIVKKDTPIIVDIENSIALIHNIHIDIHKTEYEVFN